LYLRAKQFMPYLLHHLIHRSAILTPDAPALLCKGHTLSYGQLAVLVNQVAGGLRRLPVAKGARVAIYLPKQFETVCAMFGASAAGGVFVPVNPLLKPEQVGHILQDCSTHALITSPDRAKLLRPVLDQCQHLRHVIIVGECDVEIADAAAYQCIAWRELLDAPLTGDDDPCIDPCIDMDVAAILYTSGSTGRPKGVVLSHRNMLAGARSVATYLRNTASDRILAVLPFSFDYGLSQLTTAFSVGASVVLMDYLLPADVTRALGRYGITGLAAVPPLWNQLAALDWPEQAVRSLRYITNSGGAMPLETTRRLRTLLPDTDVYLMYGLTEAFRSTYLPPAEVDERPDSIGKAIPNAEILVVRPDGTECDADEPGELVHRGALVALGYWGDPDKTAARFKPAPGQPPELPHPELAVWSGDQVRRDRDGFLYFIGRTDEQIKTSGYRVSPGEIEEVAYQLPDIEQAVAFGVPHPQLGSGIVLLFQADSPKIDTEAVRAHCRAHLPTYMVPGLIERIDDIPRNPNGKLDRKSLSTRYHAAFADPSPAQ
jgi:acyl-CoA ligase (AMP-forming) (exosortase A-associated)